ncbi:hypothetical protein ALC60_07452, partial [Trachymyrmex zeteki]
GLWTIESSILSIIGYTVVIPVVSALGIIGNSLILAVHLKAKTYLKGSTYIHVFSRSNFHMIFIQCLRLRITCVLLVFSGLARGIFRCYKGWLEFDAFVHFPIGSITSNITVWAALGVSVRLIIVCSMPRRKSPRFCRQEVARKLMIFATFFAILINMPYCFMYKYNERGELDQARLTIMLVGIVFLFLVGELPTHLASRRSAVSLFYGGDLFKVREDFMER